MTSFFLLFLLTLFNCKVGVIGTCYSSSGVAILGELQFVYKVAAPTKALIKGPPIEQELTPNFVTVQPKRRGLPRLVQEPPPPGLTDTEDSDDELEEDEDDEGHEGMQFFQMDNFMAGIHGVEGLLGQHQGPEGA